MLAERKESYYKKRRVANYLWLVLLLTKNPELIEERNREKK